MPDYLYELNWKDDEIKEKATGRVLFEYSPNLDGRKTGRLIMEDGGVRPQEGLGPGPVGPFEFDFGPAAEMYRDFFWRW